MKALKYILVALGLLLIIIAFGTAFYFWGKYDAVKNSVSLGEKQIQEIVSRVGDLTLLPTGEEPVVAIITEPEKFAGQPFFSRALQGDTLIVYNKAGKAYIYRPSIGKLVEATLFNPSVSTTITSTPEDAEIQTVPTTLGQPVLPP